MGHRPRKTRVQMGVAGGWCYYELMIKVLFIWKAILIGENWWEKNRDDKEMRIIMTTIYLTLIVAFLVLVSWLQHGYYRVMGLMFFYFCFLCKQWPNGVLSGDVSSKSIHSGELNEKVE